MMESKKFPPRMPLERSSQEGGDWNRYSREAGDNSSGDAPEAPRRRNMGTMASTSEFSGQPRRRRRISEMQRVGSSIGRTPSHISEAPLESMGGTPQSTDRTEQQAAYKEAYNRHREEQRQRGGEGSGYRKASGGGRKQQTGVRKPSAPKRRPPVYAEDPIDITEEIRLNKFLSNAGVCSRREADTLISVGGVLVNGVPVTELGTKITAQDRVEVNGREVKPENKVYVLLNKPRNCVTTTDDPQERMTVSHLVRTACRERIYPVGRLDMNTTGVLLLTNDGELAAKLVHPSYKKKKIYHVWLDKEVSAEDMQRIADGIELQDGEMHADAISYVAEDDLTQVGIEIHSGRNRIVRRIFEHLGYRVKKLDRVYFAGLTKKNLGRGKWRYLTQEEVSALQNGIFE